MKTYIKRLQTRASRKGIKATLQQCREVYQSIVGDLENPLEDEMSAALEKLEQLNSPAQEEEPTMTEGLVVASETGIEQPSITEITPESNPDIWEILQPPVEEPQPTQKPQPEPAENFALAPSPAELPTKSDSSLVPTPNNPQLITGLIPQGHIEGLVSKTFANQPQGFKDRITDYALQHSFEDVRQVQDFLEQLRTMEFDLLVQTLQDHFSRRDSMLTVLNTVLTSQKKSDEAKRQDFLDSFTSQVQGFKREMEAKLAKTGL